MEETGYGKKIVAKMDGFSVGGTIMEIAEGKKTDMVFHVDIDKVVYLLGGELTAYVLRDGKMAGMTLKPGASFYVRRGLVHQFEAVKASIVVEFVSDINQYEKDINIITRGTVLPPVEPGELAKMTPEDEAKLEEEEAKPVKKTPRKRRPINRKATSKKSPTKKKPTAGKKKTTRKKRK